MLSKGIIHLEMGELWEPGAQGVYVEAVKSKDLLCHCLDVNLGQWGSWSRSN